MTASFPSRVVFFQVREAKMKLCRLAETVRQHFHKQEPLIIFAEDAKAQSFADELLWKWPETSFLPHTISQEPTKDPLVITTTKTNLNQAKIAFNLCPTPLLIDGPFRIIYDFEDTSSLAKKQLSSLRFDAYKQAHYLIEAIPS